MPMVGRQSCCRDTIRRVSEAALAIYRRSEGYYLVVSAQTTAGVWQHVAESAGADEWGFRTCGPW